MPSVLVAIAIGLLVGLVARALMPGREPMGWALTILLGISGSVLASFAGQSIGWYSYGEPAGFITAVLGAMALLALSRVIRDKPRHRA